MSTQGSKPGPAQSEARPARRGSRFKTVGTVTAPTAEPADQPAPQGRPAPAPAEPPEPEAVTAEAEAPQGRPVPAPSRPGRAPAKEVVPPKYDARMSLTLPQEMKQALDIARAMDRIEGTARIRAMIRLWQTDDRFRRRVDRAALEEKD